MCYIVAVIHRSSPHVAKAEGKKSLLTMCVQSSEGIAPRTERESNRDLDLVLLISFLSSHLLHCSVGKDQGVVGHPSNHSTARGTRARV